MAWEDGASESVWTLIDAADIATDEGTKLSYLQQALSSAKCVKDSNKRKNLIILIEDKIRDL